MKFVSMLLNLNANVYPSYISAVLSACFPKVNESAALNDNEQAFAADTSLVFHHLNRNALLLLALPLIGKSISPSDHICLI